MKYNSGDKLRIKVDRPNWAKVFENDVVTVITDEGNSHLFVTGKDGRPAEGFEDRGWLVQRNDVEPAVEEKDGYVPIVGESRAVVGSDGKLGTLVEVVRCVTGRPEADYKFDGPASAYGLVHDDRITWLVPTDQPTIDPFPEPTAEPVWEEGSYYRHDSYPAVADFEVIHVDEDGDAYGVKVPATGSSWKTHRSAQDRKQYKEVE